MRRSRWAKMDPSARAEAKEAAGTPADLAAATVVGEGGRTEEARSFQKADKGEPTINAAAGVELHLLASSTLVNRLQAVSEATAVQQQQQQGGPPGTAGGLGFRWPLNDECPVAYSTLFSAPDVKMAPSDDSGSCEAWQSITKSSELTRAVKAAKDAEAADAERMAVQCFRVDGGLYSQERDGAVWYRELQPSNDIAARIASAKMDLKWADSTWVAVHLMNPRLVFTVPHPKPKMPPQSLPIQTIVPYSSYMYEMMMASQRLLSGDKGANVRFLLISDSPEAVNGLAEEASAMFHDSQLVKWTRNTSSLSFGKNTADGLADSTADVFLMANASKLIHVTYSSFGRVAGLIGGKTPVVLGEFEGRRDAMDVVLRG